MATISSQLKINDGMSSVLRRMNSALTMVIDSFDDMQEISGRSVNTANISAARRELALANSQLNEVQNRINNNTNAQDQYTSAVNRSASATKSLFSAIAGFSIVHKIISMVVGQLDSAINRMDTMSNFERTMTAITGSSDAAKASLSELKKDTKGTAYGLDTAAQAVQNFTTRGMSIGQSTKEVSKWMDAVAFYGKGTNEQLSNVTDALGKMLSKGKVEMEQLNRLTDAGINAVGIYAQATGKSSAQVQSELTKGVITSRDFITTVSTAFSEGTNGVLNISGAAKEAGGTWATSLSNMKAAMTRGVISVIESINGALSESGFGTMLDGVQNFGSVAEIVLGKVGNGAAKMIKLFSPIGRLAKWTADIFLKNWPAIKPIIIGIVAALAVYKAAQVAINTVSMISAGLLAIETFQHNAKMAAVSLDTGATFAATAAQWGFNAALYACPITWIVIAIMAFIAALYLGIAILNKFAGTSISATGIVFGVFSLLGANIGNVFIGLWNIIASFVNFFGNVFKDPVAAVKMLFYDLFLTVTDYVANLARNIEKLINKIPGVKVDITSGLDNFYNWLEKGRQKVKDESEWIEYAKQKEYIDYGNAWNSGYGAGSALASSVKDIVSGFAYDDLFGSLDSIDENTGSTAASLKITEEDLKYMRDLAEQEVINRFTTAEVKIDMSGMTNRIDSNMDLDGVLTTFTEGFAEALEVAAEGVHE